MANILLTGGGTAGHVTANLALLPELRKEHTVFYMGSRDGIEKELAESAGLSYFGISTGKFRRYFSLRNLTDPFRVVAGFFQARKQIKAWKIDLVFSKGGFVAVPVIFAAASLGIPIICHESDFTPGLANKLTIPFTKKICCNFQETVASLPKGKAVCTGAPIRAELLLGSREEGLKRCGFSGEKPVLMVIGGSLGSVAINQAVRANCKALGEQYDIIHICGKHNLDESLEALAYYKQFAYVKEELADLYQAADFVISRAGANVIYEILALKKPNILIPLPKKASRGDQILNAASFSAQGFSVVLPQEELEENPAILPDCLEKLRENQEKYIKAMEASRERDGRKNVLYVIQSVLDKKS